MRALLVVGLFMASCGSSREATRSSPGPEASVAAVAPVAADAPPVAAPDLADAPAALAAAADGCTRGVAVDCTRVGDHYVSNVSDGRGRQLYQRAADLDWAQMAAAPVIAATAGGLADPAAAVAAARAAWPVVVNGLPVARQEWAQGLSARVAAAPVGAVNDGLDAKPVAFRDAFRWAHQLTYEHDGALRGAVLAGTLADLRRDGTCWAVMFHGGMKGEFIVYLAREDGRVLAVTVIPEG
jgi:hypothetical protein